MIKYGDKWRYTVIGVCFIAHCLLALLPSINLEFAFVDAARYFQVGNRSLIDQYFRFQANTLGLPYLSWLASVIFPNHSMLTVIRLLSTSGIILLGIGVINFCRYLNRNDSISLLIVILLNPLIWTFSARATADFLPAALGIFAISLAILPRKTTFHIFCAGVLLGIAAILKYHAIFLLLVLATCQWDAKSKHFDARSFLIISGISTTLLAMFLTIIHESFGFWVAPPVYQSIHGLNFGGLLNNFFLYIGYLILLCAPSSMVFPEWKNFFLKNRSLMIAGSVSIFFLGYIGFQDSGELNLGPLDQFMNKNLMAGIFLLLSSLFLIPLISNSGRHIKSFNLFLALAILGIIAVFSLTRPAQRYLLIVLPFFFFLVPPKVLGNKKVFVCSISLYALINLFIGYSQWCTGTAAIMMVEAIKEAGLMKVTNPGVIEGHLGNQFDINIRGDSKYIVIAGDSPAAQIKVSSGISFTTKTFSLVEVTQIPTK